MDGFAAISAAAVGSPRTAPRILFAGGRPYLPENVGGIERNTQALAALLRGQGVACAVLAALSPDGGTSRRVRILRKLVPAAYAIPDRLTGTPVYRYWHPAAAVPTVLRAFRPSVAVVQYDDPAELTESLLRHGVPVVLYCHEVLFATAERRVAPHPCLAVLAVSEFVAARARDVLGVQPAVVHPVVVAGRYRTATTRREVLFVNPRPLKGADIAWALAAARPDIPFRFVEAWSPDPRLRAEGLHRARGLPNVAWSAPRRDMRPLYGRAKLLLVPSRVEEAAARVVMEAQVSGIPVLASDRGGLPEMVGPGGLLLSPEAGPAAWAAALSRLWDDPACYRRHAEAALRHAGRTAVAVETVVADFLARVSAHALACGAR